MKMLASNRRARFDYQITDKLIAGLVLSGPEVKSAKSGQVSLKGSFISVKNGEAFLTNAHFTPYAHSSQTGFEPTRSRKLLLHRREIETLMGSRGSGQSAVPLNLVLDRNLIKLEIGVGRGKKRYDKRETLRRRDQEREASRELKR